MGISSFVKIITCTAEQVGDESHTLGVFQWLSKRNVNNLCEECG
jgi:hypothetical protein